MDRLGLPRSNILAYTMPGFATSDHTKGNAVRLMESLGVTWRELDIRPAARQMLADMNHPFGKRRAGLRRDVRERAGGPAHRLPVPPCQPERRHRHRHRRPVGTGAGLVHLWRRRPDGALQRQFRRAEDADPASDPLGDLLRPVRAGCRARRWTRFWGPRSRPSWCPWHPARRPRAPRRRSGPTSCRTSTCTTRCATASARRRSPSWRCMPGAMRSAATGRPASRRSAAGATTLPQIRHWLGVFLQRFFGFSQFKRVGHAERPEGQRRRLAVAARRLACAVRRRRPARGWTNWSGTCRASRRRFVPSPPRGRRGRMDTIRHRDKCSGNRHDPITISE